MANFTNIITAAAAAIVISTACIGAAVGPATTAGQSPMAYSQVAQVSATDQADRA